jgi:hypothetical protein
MAVTGDGAEARRLVREGYGNIVHTLDLAAVSRPLTPVESFVRDFAGKRDALARRFLGDPPT